MKFPMYALSSITASIALLSAPAFAAGADTTKPRASATAAQVPPGQPSTYDQVKGTPPMGSDTTRAEVKAEAAAAVKDGTALPAGERIGPSRKEVAKKHSKSNTTRAEVKKEAIQAEKDGTLPAGEASTKQQPKGGKL